LEWQYISLSDERAVEGLIKYRGKFYSHYLNRNNSIVVTKDPYHSNLNHSVCENLLCTYVWLDECIENCGLTSKQKEVLNLYINDYTTNEIAKELNTSVQNVRGILNSVFKKIVDYNNYCWKHEFILWSKKKVETSYKNCNKCKRWLPETTEFFKYDVTNNRFKAKCRRCDN